MVIGASTASPCGPGAKRRPRHSLGPRVPSARSAGDCFGPSRAESCGGYPHKR
jgi:hypothetical protein